MINPFHHHHPCSMNLTMIDFLISHHSPSMYLLGGFAIFIGRTDFWVVTVILVSEGARIFSRSHELEWQHQSTWTLTSAGPNSFRLIRSGSRYFWRVIKALFNPFSAVKPDREQDRQIKEDVDKAQEFEKKLVRYVCQIL